MTLKLVSSTAAPTERDLSADPRIDIRECWRMYAGIERRSIIFGHMLRWFVLVNEMRTGRTQARVLGTILDRDESLALMLMFGSLYEKVETEQAELTAAHVFITNAERMMREVGIDPEP